MGVRIGGLPEEASHRLKSSAKSQAVVHQQSNTQNDRLKTSGVDCAHQPYCRALVFRSSLESA